ncbi:MAG: Crp/Fnr family transcriptional regulator [Actinobacteria bacterium]|nr:Crp/Fnr family transcriptional regulator [Actinomycetota bacterium]
MKKLEQLKKISLFDGFSQSELSGIAEITKERKLKKDTVVFHENDPANALYIIKSGSIKIFKISEDGREHIIEIFELGQIFGEVPVFDGGSYPATAMTLSETEIYIILKSDFENTVKKYPDIALKIIRVLGRRLRQAHNKIHELAFKNVPQKMASLLLRLAEKNGKPTEKGILIAIPLSRQQIAELIGVSRETATRELNRFNKLNLIFLNKKEIIIIDKQKLSSIAKSD